ncbi:MAG: glycosyltransferase family 4 protein [Candidatus Zambryskibacteria bacterium]|nr:glycosyltransferase family 4 protein [Candidatus Zambryskibacteria bacterium]
MKILFLSDDFPPQSFGGAGISTYDLALGMKKASHEVFVITTCRKESEAGEIDYNGLKVFKIASDYPGRWRSYVSLYNRPVVHQVEELLKRIRPEVVHANNIHHYLSYHSLKIAKKYAKVVITFRDVMSFSFGKLMTERYLKTFDARTTWLDHLKQARKRWNPFRNLIIKYYLGYADKKFAVSYALKKALEQNGIRDVEVIHTGIDLQNYSPSPRKNNKKTIFFAGRLSDAKGAKVVEKAFEIVKQEMSEAELRTAGTDGKWLNRDEMRMAYAVSDIVLVPSVCFDAFPRTVLEAMASGRPVISTPYGGAKEVIEDGVTGYIVNPFKTDELAEKIMDLLKNPEKAERFGKAGRARIKTDFNLDDKIAKLVSIYEELI